MSAPSGAASVFGTVHLGYIVIETDRFADWRRFGTDAIGMHCDLLCDELMRFRLDEQECRFLLRRGPAEDVVATGWHIDDHAAFEQIESRVRAHGVPAVQGSAFVTGDSGMGHIALTSTRPARLRGYFNAVFDARLTDYIDETISGVKLKIRFLRVHELGFDMALSVGQHTNDKELSYYARSPSGFEWEVGWNPVVIDEATWQPATHQGISVWGHTPVGQTIVDKLVQFRRGARSLTRREDTVPALSGAGSPDARPEKDSST